MAHSPNPKHTPGQWQHLIEQQATSGLSQEAFCASQGLAKGTFQYWKRRLRRGALTGRSQAPTDVLFTPLPDMGMRHAQPSRDGWLIELDLGNGMCLRLRRGP